MKRILVVSYYWPPTGGSGVQRWVKFSKYLPQLGWQPVIYTPENPEQLARDESLLCDIPAEVEVVKTGIWEPYEAYRKLTGKAALKPESNEINPLNARKKSFSKRLAVWVRGNLFVPDPRVFWVRPSVKFLSSYLKEHPVDTIVTTGPPQSMHLIGRDLKRLLIKESRWKEGMKWIADFRDPWTELFYFKHMGLWPIAERKHRLLEQSVLDESDGIISVTPLVRKDFQARTSTPVHLITNGFDTDDFPDTAPVLPDNFTIVHTGLFASDGNPLNLWKVLAELCDSEEGFRDSMKLRLVGKVDAEIAETAVQAGLKDNIELTGYMPHDATVIEQRGASMLILPLRQEPEYRKVLPGKIFEYLAARRPVLGIGQEDGAAATVLKDTGAGEMYDWDRTEPLREFVLRQWRLWKSGIVLPPLSDISSYSRLSLTRKLTEIL